jgi:hypothetical protein
MAQTLKFGNGTFATKKGSTLAYNDENNNFKPLPFTTTRNSIATRVNKEGLIEVVGNDIPRIDYTDSADGVLLLEPERTNTYLNSEPTTNESSMLGVTYESFNWVIGFTNCVKYGDNSATRYRYGGTISASTEYTLSAFVIMDDLSEPIIGGQTSDKDFSFVLGGSVVNPNSSVNMGNNIWRVSSTAITSALPAATNNGIIKYTAQSNKGFRVVGYQLEQLSYPTSYIPTNGSTVTRQADTASGSGNSEVFNDSEGVLFADIAALANDGTNRMISLSDGSSNNRILIKYDNITNRLEFFVFSGGVGEYSFITTSLITTSNNKIAFKYKQNDFEIWGNGFELDTNTSGNTPIGLSELAFDDGSGSNNFYGKTKEIGYYDTALTDEELEYMTSYRTLNELVTELNLNEL